MTSRVLIFHDQLVAPSETFIPAQAESMRRYQPWYLCSRALGPVPSPERTIVLNQSRRLNLAEIAFKATGWVPGLRQRIAAINPFLVHAHFGPDGLRVLPLARSLKVPLIVTYHGFDATMSSESMMRSFPAARSYAKHKTRVICGADRFIAVSRFIASKLVEQGFPEERIRQHYIGIDPAFFRPQGGVERKPMVLFVGRLVGVKGCEDLITAMTDVQQAAPETELVVIGDGPFRQHLENMARTSLRCYRFLGTQPPAVVREWMNQARILCVPSKRDISGAEEGFGIVFAEAQAMETPVVSYASGGIPEAVQHGVTGLLAPEGNHKVLAEYIIQLLRDGVMRARFALAGREHVLSQFDIRKQSAKLEEIYDEVLRSDGARSSASPSTLEVNTCA